MNKGTVILGVIIIIVGVYLIAYNERIFLYSEPQYPRQWVPQEQVESMKAQGWGALEDFLQIKCPYCGREQIIWSDATNVTCEVCGATFATPSGDVLMIKETPDYVSYYATVYPYQTVGAIVALIGFVTSIIGTQLDSRRYTLEEEEQDDSVEGVKELKEH